MAAAASGSSSINYIDRWFDIIDKLKETCPSVAPALNGTYGYECGGKLLINTKDKLIGVLTRSPENCVKILSAINQLTGLTLSNKILVGYRENLDRSLAGGGESKAEAKISPEEARKALLEKAENGGVPVETI
ncbi:unknown [Ruminococcus sp. CAG:353]|nr:unknown [Ruminococcus sp. CAG:353]